MNEGIFNIMSVIFFRNDSWNIKMIFNSGFILIMN